LLENTFIDLANHMADAAGEILRKAFRQPVSIDQKSDASPVTAADRAVELCLRQLIESHFPDHGIIGEEFGNVRPKSPYQWVIDPIDGTRAFIAGYPTFTTLIALAYEGIPILGMIDQPIAKERWVGIEGEKNVQITGAQSLKHALIATTSTPYYFSADENAAFERIRTQCAQTIIGGDGYGYAMLASGHIDIFMDVCLKPYDFCALKPVIEAAGGIITDWNGKPLTIHSDGRVVACANKALHEAIMPLLAR
jgi:inositol-phosphate phosphatase / L-galactose 1-phosphate phosphatase / histidinol-phosphatase